MKQNTLLRLLANESLFADGLDNALEQLLPLVASAMEVDRVSVWGPINEAGISLSLKNFDAVANRFTKNIPILASATIDGHWKPDSFRLLCVADIQPLRQAGHFSDNYFQEINIAAVLAAPVLVKGRRRALVVAEMIASTREWENADKQFIFAVSCIVAMILENDKQKRIAADLQESEKRLSISQKFANIGTWDWDIGTNTVHWSEQVAPLFGFSETIPETHRDVVMAAVHPDDRQGIEKAVQACIHQGSDYDIEYRVIWEDGTVCWLHETGDVTRDEFGRPLRMLGVVRDSTLRHEYETALLEARDAAEIANEAKSEFLSRMSHELRTPLNAILGFSQLLELDSQANLTENQLDSLAEIRNAGKHLVNLINEVLDLAKIEAGHTDLQLEPLRIKEIFRDSLVLVAAMFAERNIRVRNLWQDMPNASVIADRTRVKQVLVNLLSNAAKYANDNAIVEVGFEQLEPHRLRCFVRDNGPGIAESRQSELFKAFSRLDQGNSQVEGSGIGLLIAKKIVEQMNGRMGVDSKLGIGSCFWFDLVLISQLESGEGQRSVAAEQLWQQLAGFSQTRRVLYVEDNPPNIRLVEQIIAKIPGTQLLSTHDPNCALELASSEELHLVLLDLHLPLMNGYDLLQKMHKLPRLVGVPIVAISAHAMEQDRDRVRQAGFDGFIAKPYSVSEFVSTLYRYISEPEQGLDC